MSGRSPIDSLARLAPVSDAVAASAFGAAREELLDGVTREPFGRRTRPRPMPRRRRLVLAVAVLALASIATAATWVVIARKAPARETTSVECVIKGVDTILPSSSGDPSLDCAVEWKRELGKAAPPLAAYDNTYGGVTVLPRSQKPPAGWKPLKSQDVALIELQDSLDDYVNGLNSSCLDASAATALTRAKLAAFGFTGWTVSVSNVGAPAAVNPPSSANAAPTIKITPGIRTCSGGAVVDPATRTVSLGWVGVPARPDVSQKLADKLRPLTRTCPSLPAAVAGVRSAAGSLGLTESARTYELNAVRDNSLRCASVYETVGGTIFLTVRGPRR